MDEYRSYQIERSKQSPTCDMAKVKTIISALLKTQTYLRQALFSKDDLKRMLNYNDASSHKRLRNDLTQDRSGVIK